MNSNSSSRNPTARRIPALDPGSGGGRFAPPPDPLSGAGIRRGVGFPLLLLLVVLYYY